jgi:GNAT superfamily N-acetyltransferase
VAIRLAKTDAEIAACHAVMRELRPHVAEGDFVARVRRQERSGYRLAYLERAGRPRAAAGFRLGETLAWGRFLYVDDLVTLADERSRGHGAALLRWLEDLARAEGCAEFHLDSGVQRTDAHRFYRREGLDVTSYHFSRKVAP